MEDLSAKVAELERRLSSEGALERIRSRTMAMKESAELKDVIAVVFEEAVNLGIGARACDLVIFDELTGGSSVYISGEAQGDHVIHFTTPRLDHAHYEEAWRAWRAGERLRTAKLEGPVCRSYMSVVIQSANASFEQISEQFQQVILQLQSICHTEAYTRSGFFRVASEEPLRSDEEEILVRFAKVFDQTYTRFLDLQKAEALARDAQIEFALERVRSQTMAMRHSDDIYLVSTMLFHEVGDLGIYNLRCGVLNIFDELPRCEVWPSMLEENTDILHLIGRLDMNIHPLLEGIFAAWEQQEGIFQYELFGEDSKQFYQTIANAPDYHLPFDETPDRQVCNAFIFSEGALFSFTPDYMDEETYRIWERFRGAFSFAYSRHKDLLHAEAQVREAQVEAALERIRAQSMAMQQSGELGKIIHLIYDELQKLGLPALSCAINVINDDQGTITIWTTDWTWNDVRHGLHGFEDSIRGEDPIIAEILSVRKSGVECHTMEKPRAFLKNYIEFIVSHQSAPKEWLRVSDDELPASFRLSITFFRQGVLQVQTPEPLTEPQMQIQQRFTKSFEQTYTRFLDLKLAEQQARLARQQAASDRIRAEITSMRTPKDLERITPLIWKELINLGVPFFRCGVFIMDEPRQIAHTYLTSPEGESLAAIDLDFGSDFLADEAIDSWRQQEVYVTEWDQQQFVEFTKGLLAEHLIDDPEKYQHGNEPPNRLVLHLVPFKQGMLYVGNADYLDVDQVELVSVLARTFSVAYARYEDFTQLEEAKQRVESALSDLQSTQSQLVHAEKMASLGELTAGIAHEIQNPLNFVNNFSDLNKELIEDLREELKDGNIEEVEAILTDLFGNEEKILFHGKRAEEIVKSMLQHSRAGDGEKRPADINAIADEYLRLSYHGLRAKDKSFNAEFKAHLAEDLPEVNVVPQDIGRVLLNLINNAFSAVSEKRALYGNGYVPTVEVFTKKLRNSIEIRVKDNGPGVPDDIREKIFQPFFTTKPTGSGTGLGLSLSYDIVTKGHGGTLEMDTSVGGRYRV